MLCEKIHLFLQRDLINKKTPNDRLKYENDFVK